MRHRPHDRQDNSHPRALARLAIALLLSGGSLLASSCHDSSTGPATDPTGDIALTITTSGADEDVNGYLVFLDGAGAHWSGSNGTVRLSGVTPGMHSIRIAEVDVNCTVEGGADKPVSVPAGATVTVTVSVACTERAGGIAVSVVTERADLAPAQYAVKVDGGTPQPIAVNGSAAIRVRPGTHVVALEGTGAQCYARGGAVQVTEVGIDSVVPLQFGVTCVAAVSVRVTTTTTGPQPSGYRVIATAADVSRTDTLALPASGVLTASLFPGKYDLILAGVEGNCALTGGPARLDVEPDTPRDVTLAIVCVAQWQLAFVREGMVYLVNSDGTGARVVGSGTQPSWSPDGQRLAVVRQGVVWTMNADGSDARVVNPVAGVDASWPAWSPDGREIAFSAVQDGGRTIFVTSAPGYDSRVRRVGFDRGFQDWPTWSPDGRAIAFTSDWAAFDFALDVYAVDAVDAAGTTPRQVTNGFFGPEANWPSYMQYAQPAWSPDGRRFALVACPAWQYANCTESSIAVMESDGSNIRRLAAAGGFARPAWSPDGRMIAFAASGGIRILMVDGSAPGRIIGAGADPAWRPSIGATEVPGGP